jgi:hypothetical protein
MESSVGGRGCIAVGVEVWLNTLPSMVPPRMWQAVGGCRGGFWEEGDGI